MSSRSSLSTPRVQTGTLYFVALLREELGRRIAAARVSAGLSQRELAERIYLKNASDISRYERGKVEVPSHRIDLIAEATGRTRSYFVRDPAEPDPAPAEDVVSMREELSLVLEKQDRMEQMIQALLEQLRSA